MKDLPKVFANQINKKIDNSQDMFYGSDRSFSKKDNISLDRKINNISSSNHHVYKSNVRIITKDNDLEKVIVGRTGNSLITIDGELININKIVDIEKI